MSEKIKPEGIGELQEKDYRGLLALGFTAGFFATSIVALISGGIPALQFTAAVLGPLEGSVLGFYFGRKSKS